MATDYTVICDFCGAKICGKSTDWPVKNNNWRISICNHWLDRDEDSENYVMAKQQEIDKDACADCVKRVSEVIRQMSANNGNGGNL